MLVLYNINFQHMVVTQNYFTGLVLLSSFLFSNRNQRGGICIKYSLLWIHFQLLYVILPLSYKRKQKNKNKQQ